MKINFKLLIFTILFFLTGCAKIKINTITKEETYYKSPFYGVIRYQNEHEFVLLLDKILNRYREAKERFYDGTYTIDDINAHLAFEIVIIECKATAVNDLNGKSICEEWISKKEVKTHGIFNKEKK